MQFIKSILNMIFNKANYFVGFAALNLCWVLPLLYQEANWLLLFIVGSVTVTFWQGLSCLGLLFIAMFTAGYWINQLSGGK